jgi:uncharacterized membrane protein YgcG
MKKTWIALLLCLLLCLALMPAAAAEGTLAHVTDEPGILTAAEKNELETRAAAFGEKYHCEIYIVVINDYRERTNGDVGACAEELYSYFDLGYGADRDGLLLLLSMADRDYALTSYGHFADACFNDHNKDLVEKNFLDNFRGNDWFGGFSDYLDLADDILATAVSHGFSPEQESQRFSGLKYPSLTYRYSGVYKMPVGLKLLIGLGVPCLIALAVCSAFKAQMKTARLATTAEAYVVPGSADLQIQEDRFINRTETRVPIQTSSGSRGGGGGGGGFHTHTGKF